MRFSIIFFLLSLFLVNTVSANQRDKDEYEGRRAGGWSHAKWRGEPYPDDPNWGPAYYGVSGWGWGAEYGPTVYYEGEENPDGTSLYYPYIYVPPARVIREQAIQNNINAEEEYSEEDQAYDDQ